MQVDTIDAQTLQSQIDMSMSLVHNLVSSWVKPSQKTTKSTDTQRELEELMRRPPRYVFTNHSRIIFTQLFLRLGVGAPIPESSAASRDTARLKNHLIGKKRTRDEAQDDKKPSQSSDDGEDSRAAVVRKKTKPDPFAGSKKKRNQPNGLFTPRDTLGSSQSQPSNAPASAEMDVDQDVEAGAAGSTPSPRKKKAKQTINRCAGTTTKPVSPTPPARDSVQKISAAIVHNNAAGGGVPQSPVNGTSLGAFRTSECLLGAH